MKAIMINCSAEKCLNILSRIQSILVLKNRPKDDLPIDVYICCAKGKGKLWLEEDY